MAEIRIFEESTKKAVYAQQTDEAKSVENQILCALETGNNSKRIGNLMKWIADHVTNGDRWSYRYFKLSNVM